MSAPELQPAPAVLRATIQIKRAATGQVETYELIGTPVAEPQEASDGGDTSDVRS